MQLSQILAPTGVVEQLGTAIDEAEETKRATVPVGAHFSWTH
jgi:hypothetical protein